MPVTENQYLSSPQYLAQETSGSSVETWFGVFGTDTAEMFGYDTVILVARPRRRAPSALLLPS
jgi:hypothetical protein